MKINYNGNSYPLKRMIINRTANKYNYISKVYDIRVAFLTIFTKIFPKLDKKNVYNRRLFIWKPIKKINGILHVFNSVYIGKSNWVCTIEHMYPAIYHGSSETEYGRYCKRLKKYLLKSNCIALLPLSDYSKNVIVGNLSKYYSREEVDIVERKIRVMHPPQKILITENEIAEKYKNIKKVKICFVGRDFYRKGGYTTFKCLKKLSERYDNFEFIVVSSLNKEKAAYCDNNDIRKEFEKYDFVKWYEELPNDQVLQILRECHIGVLPTYGDTYGFSVLEMQAAGCPVITCNNYALSEINSDLTGWVLDIQSIVEKIGKDYSNIDIVEKTEKYLVEEMEKIFEDLFTDRNEMRLILKNKAINSMKRIEEFHNPQKYEAILNEIYSKCENSKY